MGVTRTKKGQDGKGRLTVSGIKPREEDRENGKPPSVDAILDRRRAVGMFQTGFSRSPLRPFRIALLHFLLHLLNPRDYLA